MPTLAFGIPGSSTMAIVIAALLAFGIQPGPEMFTTHIDLVWMLVWILVITNFIAVAVSLGLVPAMRKLTAVRSSIIAPPILILALLGGYSTNNNILDIVVVIVFGFIGYMMKVFGYSRPIFLIGFVLGGLLESNYLLTMNVWGASFLRRPLVIILLAVGVFMVAGPKAKEVFSKRSKEKDSERASR